MYLASSIHGAVHSIPEYLSHLSGHVVSSRGAESVIRRANDTHARTHIRTYDEGNHIPRTTMSDHAAASFFDDEEERTRYDQERSQLLWPVVYIRSGIERRGEANLRGSLISLENHFFESGASP